NFEPIFVSKDSVNPHTWLDPVYECEIIDLISDRFSVINPSAKESYKGKAKRLQENIRKLHKNMEADASAGMLKDVYVVCSHPSLAYFFKRYGIDNVDYIQTGDGEEPSVKHLNRLISKARSAKRCVVVCEEQINDKAADTIIRESGAEKVEFNPQTPNYADDMWRLFVSLTD
ncbi:MAG: zinc ABC transporter substrate-binding protein, partial [Abditibacteriota bacterium]|nr:zinc ABC transporter substrate-binding protein [Abditibacteriota bacterium]